MPPPRSWPRPSRARRRLALGAAAVAATLLATLAGALVDAGGAPPGTAVAAPAGTPAPSPDPAVAAVSIEDPGDGASIPLADLLLPEADGRLGATLPHDALDLRRARGPRLTVPILMYHYIRVNPVAHDRLGDSLSVTPADFAAQMAMLKRAGMHTVSLTDITSALGGGPPLPAHAVAITFDDGYRDFSTAALPVLRAEGFTATVFVVSGFVGRPGYMTAAGIVAAAAAGMTIGAHTVHHVELAHIPASLARAEIEVSRQQLEQLSGQPVDDFAYPYGDTSRAVQAMVVAAGFHDAVTTVFGSSAEPWQQFSLSRVRIEGGDSLATVAGKVLRPLGLPWPALGRARPTPAAGALGRAPGAPY